MSHEFRDKSLEMGPAWDIPKYEKEYHDIFNSSANISNEDFLKMSMGPKQVQLQLLIPITIIYIIMFFTGLLGNLAICYVISRIKSMHTATNFYLLSLAAADIIILTFGLPNELLGFWHQYPYLQGEIFCKFRSYLSELASYASVLTIVSFSMERYVAIVHPLHMMYLEDFKRAFRVLTVCWSIASISAIPYLLFTKINYLDNPFGSGNYLNDSAFCALLDINIYPKNYPIHEVSTILFFIIPVTMLTYLYARMAIKLKGSFGNSVGSGYVHGNRETDSNKKQIISMLAAIVCSFFICWAPFHAQRLGYVYFKESKTFRTINEYLMYVSGITYYLSSTINPILYNLMSRKYNDAFKKVFCMNESFLQNQKSISRDNEGIRGRGLISQVQQNTNEHVNSIEAQGSTRRKPLPLIWKFRNSSNEVKF